MPKHALIIIAALTIAAPASAGQIRNDFVSDAEGWLIQDVDCVDFGLQGQIDLDWRAADGDPDGYVEHRDVTGHCSYFRAPASYTGDLTSYMFGTLSFSLRSTDATWYSSDQAVLIGAGLVLCHELPQLPPTAWHRYSVPLIPSAFTYGIDGAMVTAPDFEAVMADVEILLLPAEFGDDVEETVGLDSVRMVDSFGAASVPEAVAALAVHPNPFNPTTTINFTLDVAGPVQLTIHDLAGRRVRTLVDGTRAAGPQSLTWTGRDDAGRAVASGTYLLRLWGEGGAATRLITLAR